MIIKRWALVGLAVASLCLSTQVFAIELKLGDRKETSSIVTEGIIVACNYSTSRKVEQILARHVSLAQTGSQPVTVAPGFCAAFKREIETKFPLFLKAVKARILADKGNVADDPAMRAALGEMSGATTAENSEVGVVTIVTVSPEGGALAVTADVTVQ